MVSYHGIFFDEESVEIIHSLEVGQLERVNDEIHCTFKYRPSDDEIFDEVVGKEVEVYLCGYANDGNNSGFQIELSDDMIEYYINYHEEDPTRLKVPHITASLKDGAKASKTKDLDFKPIDKVLIRGRFGYWIKEDGKEFVSYSPYKKVDSKVNKKLYV